MEYKAVSSGNRTCPLFACGISFYFQCYRILWLNCLAKWIISIAYFHWLVSLVFLNK